LCLHEPAYIIFVKGILADEVVEELHVELDHPEVDEFGFEEVRVGTL